MKNRNQWVASADENTRFARSTFCRSQIPQHWNYKSCVFNFSNFVSFHFKFSSICVRECEQIRHPKMLIFEHHISISARTPSGGLPAYNMHFKKCLHFNEEAFNFFSQKISSIFSTKTRHAYFAMSENDSFFARSTFCRSQTAQHAWGKMSALEIANFSSFQGKNQIIIFRERAAKGSKNRHFHWFYSKIVIFEQKYATQNFFDDFFGIYAWFWF